MMAELIRQLVEQAEAAADAAERHLTTEAQHGRVAGVCGRECRCGVEEAGAGDDAVGARAARGRGVAVGHVAGGLLMPGDDHLQALRALVERAEQRIVLHAGQDEQGVDALRQQSLNRGLAAAHFGHVGDLPARDAPDHMAQQRGGQQSRGAAAG
jgi:hypothetical protein